MVTHSNITVRQATVLDVDILAPLFDAYRQFYRQPPDPVLARQFLEERIQRSESIVFVALNRERSPIGFTQLFPSFPSSSAARIFVLNDLFVAPSFRRQGAGSQLLGAAANFARSAGAVRLTLSTEVTNLAAQALYSAEGWKRQTDYFVYSLRLDISA
jgi:GNAT superfamily N-acetyltransferase